MATDDTREATRADTLAHLAAHGRTAELPETERVWLAAHGVRRRYAVGEVVTHKGEQAPELLILFAGHNVIRVDRGAGVHKVFEWKAGDIGGHMPYSRGASPPNDVMVEEAVDCLALRKELFADLIRACPQFTAVCVHIMIDRARHFTQNDLRDEKLVSLGKLAAGLAHELNNPASAVVRGAKQLAESVAASEDAARRLGGAGLNEQQFQLIDDIRAMCLRAAPTMMRSTLGRSDREDEFAEWLDAHAADERCAGPLADTGVTIDALDDLAAIVQGEVLNATLKWMAAGCSVRTLSGDIEAAAARIHHLVGAVKGFTYMDHAPLPEPVDIRQGISDTMVMLGSKIRAHDAHVALTLPDDLPCAIAVGGELNQVWMNLIDNAVDAAGPNGRVEVVAAHEHGRIVVRVIDNGPGIPADLQSRIFEPFFTTKGVGKGTGLGLDIVRRLLKQHDGELALDSVPGRTEFLVRLPVA